MTQPVETAWGAFVPNRPYVENESVTPAQVGTHLIRGIDGIVAREHMAPAVIASCELLTSNGIFIITIERKP
jgi:hypothetical protein